MCGIDIVFMVLLVWGGYSGFRTGFVLELVFSLWLIFCLRKGVAFGYKLYPLMVEQFPFLAAYAPVGFSVILLWVVVIGLYWLLKSIIKLLVGSLSFGMFDSCLGALLGVCKSALCISILLYFWRYVAFAPLSLVYFEHSTLFPLLESIVPRILAAHSFFRI